MQVRLCKRGQFWYDIRAIKQLSHPLGVFSPVLDERDVNGSPGPPRAQVEGAWRPEQSDAVGGVVRVERSLLEEGLHVVWQLKLLIIIRQRLLTLGRT